MEIFVVSLARCQTRRRSICLQLEHLGLRYRLFEATDGHALTDDELAQHCDLKAVRRKQLPRGHIGCTLSHYRVYRTMQEEGIVSALIIEDDALLSPVLPELLPQLEAILCDGELLHL
jgi:glycosyl transferase family 25